MYHEFFPVRWSWSCMILSGQVVVVVYDERVMPDGPGMAQVLEMFEANRECKCKCA